MQQVTIPVVPMRISPSHKAEMSNELLFGELVQVHDQINEWVEVSCVDYDYRGWILADSLEEFTGNPGEKQLLFSEFGHIEVNGILMTIPRGSVIRKESIIDGDFHSISGFSSESVVSIAKQYLQAPYRWGGRSPLGLDCSGYTQIVFGLAGMQIPRDASQQAEIGQNVSFIQEAQKGNLAFFGENDESITHVGILLDNGQIIHASGRVRIDKIDHQGIINSESGKYSHRLRLIKRLS